MATVVLYSRPRCHLCEEARAVIQAVRAEIPFDLREIDIESDDALIREYGLRIPVVAVDGEDLFEISVQAVALRAAVGG